jgi:single-stranded-DNA-specific exonuclease
MPDPSLLVDIDKLIDTVLKSKNLGIFADYDADGLTSAAMWKKCMDLAGIKSSVYIPSRQDGYGASRNGISKLLEAGADTLLFLDCGSTSIELLSTLEVPVCILDHHQIDKLPKAEAIVNPQRTGGLEVYKNLCTAGLSFLVLARLTKRLGLNCCMNLLDLAAIGTVGDVMPLVGFNKACVKRGLELINTRSHPGIKALSEVLDLQQMTSSSLAFYIIPCLNAAGRISDPNLSYNILVSDNQVECELLARTLKTLNWQRREIEQQLMLEARTRIEADSKAIFLHSPEWNPGIVGIIAGRVKEEHSKTSFVMYRDGHFWKGSARGHRCDVGGLIKASVEAGFAHSGGGHAAAGGVAIEADKLEAWKSWILDNLQESKEINSVEIDICLNENRMSELTDLADFGPFGSGNNQPKVLLKGLWLANTSEGKGYLRCTLHSGRNLVGFKLRPSLSEQLIAHKGRLLDILVSVTEVGQSKIEDARLAQEV